jgi:2'-5' RNA ligase
MYKFSIVSFFEESITEEIRRLQEELAHVTGSTGSLTAWTPHITVGSGLSVEEPQLGEFCQKIGDFLKGFSSTNLKTREFSFMDNWSGAKLGHTPYVAYIKPYEYGALGTVASFFEEELKPQYAAWYDQPWPYSPHITLAYRDLTEAGYRKAQEHLAGKTFDRSIVVDNVCLAIKENDVWQEFKRFSLK